MTTPQAHSVRVRVCENGCPVIDLFDAELKPLAEAHLTREGVEAFIADLRTAAAEGDALLRPRV